LRLAQLPQRPIARREMQPQKISAIDGPHGIPEIDHCTAIAYLLAPGRERQRQRLQRNTLGARVILEQTKHSWRYSQPRAVMTVDPKPDIGCAGEVGHVVDGNT